MEKVHPLDAAIQIRELEQKCQRRLAIRPRRKLFAVSLSYDHAQSWHLRALCRECLRVVEPPARAKTGGIAGAVACDFCGALNEI